MAGNLNGREAAQLAKSMGARLVILYQYEMFAFNTADPAEFIQASDAIAQAYQVLRCGERWESTTIPKRSE